MASEVHGTILKDGRPLVGATAKRKVTIVHSEEEIVQEAVTNNDGIFVWESVATVGMIKSIAVWAFSYEYSVSKNGIETQIWEGAKIDVENLGELRSSDLNGRISGKDFFEVDGEVLTFTYDIDSPR